MGAISPLELRNEPSHGGIHQQPSHDGIKNTKALGHPLLKQIAAQRPTAVASKPTSAKNNAKDPRRKKLSLDRLAEMIGVSKSMLGQIEHGASSPTIAVVWKIAKEDLPPLLEDNGRYRLYPFFPIENGRRFEIYTIEIDPGGSLHAEAHPENTLEFITQFEGELTVEVDGQTLLVGGGGAIRFRADRPHQLPQPGPNPGTGPAW